MGIIRIEPLTQDNVKTLKNDDVLYANNIFVRVTDACKGLKGNQGIIHFVLNSLKVINNADNTRTVCIYFGREYDQIVNILYKINDLIYWENSNTEILSLYNVYIVYFDTEEDKLLFNSEVEIYTKLQYMEKYMSAVELILN